MLRISTDRISEGMIVGQNIMDKNGRILLTAGQVLSRRYIQRIRELGVPFVYIDDQLGIEDPDPPVRSATVSLATASLRQSFEVYAQTGQTDLGEIQLQIDNIISDLTDNSHIIVGMSELKSYDDYTFQHSVNVCILSLIIGMSQGYRHSQLRDLGIGAILHDIGKIKIPLAIINKPTSLTYEEYIEVKKHPYEGFLIIKSLRGFPRASTEAILQHHERMDRRGYPRGLKGQDIHDYGLIVAVADVFDALVSDRPYRPAFNNYEAMQVMQQDKGVGLSGPYVDALFSHINMYPPGTVVCLSNGDLAVVTRGTVPDSSFPQLRLLFDVDMQAYGMDSSMELGADQDIYIKKVLGHLQGEQYMLEFLKIHKLHEH